MLEDFLFKIKNNPESVVFSELIAMIDASYQYVPTRFTNGEVINLEGQNTGSCKVFYFAKLHDLSQTETLNCFGDYYRIDVLRNPNGSDHQNIRNFISLGWQGLAFDGIALISK